MKQGCIVEFINKTNIVSAVILELNNGKLKTLTQFNEAVLINIKRIIFAEDNVYINLSRNNFEIANELAVIAKKREKIAATISVKKIWEKFKEQDIRLPANRIAVFYFVKPNMDSESAVIRALFKDRLYFQYNKNLFIPNTKKKIKTKIIEKQKQKEEEEFIKYVSLWLYKALTESNNSITDMTVGDKNNRLIKILTSFYIFEKKSPYHKIVASILKSYNLLKNLSQANNRQFDIFKIEGKEAIFKAFVKLKIWSKDINLNLLKYKISESFPKEAKKEAEDIVDISNSLIFKDYNNRKDLTMLRPVTIDGALTSDFDDALSIEEDNGNYILGVHISDAGHFIKKNGAIDIEAQKRASSIYTPDQKISMLPNIISEDICSLKEDKTSHTISIMVKLDKNFVIQKYDIIPGIIKVHRRLTYYDANLIINIDKDLEILHKIGKAFRERRFADNAAHINLPEINIWVNENKDITVNKIDKESPSRLLVSEIMIAANMLIGKFLQNNNMPAIFRGQQEPHKRFFTKFSDSLFKNWMQRRHLSPFIISETPMRHSGLGVSAYATATSPIRKYYDLVNQRQIRAVFNLETPYTKQEIKSIIYDLETPMNAVSKMQQERNRYWLLRHLETKVGEEQNGLVIGKHYNNYTTLLTDYMIICNIPVSHSYRLKQEQEVTVIISYVNAFKNIIRCCLKL
ncbi:MAG: RNB domain-containing ribonuclease [Deltaproteobacteria bacterium]|nr:RNB domain-containing ribonuclease [Deltaproteobacteria bacterium]